MKYAPDLERNVKRKDVNAKIVETLKRKKPANLDILFHELHESVFEEIDCLQCANCCKTTSPVFYMKDIERAAKAVKLKPAVFMNVYLRMDEDKDYILKTTPCPFLDYENYCTIYKDRPAACRDYPHTNRKRIVQILDLTLKNTSICPAVARIFTHLKV